MRPVTSGLTFAIIAFALTKAGGRTPDDNQPTAQPLVFFRAIELPRVEGRMDHLTLNGAGDELFVAALGNDTVEVVFNGSGLATKRPAECQRQAARPYGVDSTNLLPSGSWKIAAVPQSAF